MNLVTGATGHIGNVLIRTLLARGKKVRAMVMPGEDTTPLDELAVERVEADVLDFQSLLVAFRGIEVAYHLAGIITIMPGYDPQVQAVNVIGTRNVIEAARLSGVRRLIYTSSIHALSRIPHGITIDEKIPFDPITAISVYDHSKAQASLEVLEAVKHGLDAVIACPTGVIGPYDYRGSELGQLIKDCVNRKPMFYVDGAYDFVDVRDVAQGLALVSEKGRTGEAYILSGERLSVLSMLKTVQGAIGKHLVTLKVPMQMARFFAHFTPFYYRLTRKKPRFTPYSLETVTSNSVISHAKAKCELGYSPRPLTETLTDTVHWFLQLRTKQTNQIG